VPSLPRVGAVLPAGGRATRYGSDKVAALLPLVLDALPERVEEIVCVGPARQISVRDGAGPEPLWVREQPPYGGPLAAVAAGLAALGPTIELVLLLGADMPLVGRAVPALLAALEPPAGAAVLVADGRPQPLASAWDRPTLGAAMAAVGQPEGRPLRTLLDHVTAVEVVDRWGAGLDVDEPR
jgi:molybdopterin-guanine dinucleotide biosynthesis protein A